MSCFDVIIDVYACKKYWYLFISWNVFFPKRYGMLGIGQNNVE